jgi:hypothetical protein
MSNMHVHEARRERLIEIKGRLIDDLVAKCEELKRHAAAGTLPACVHPDYEVIRAHETSCASPESSAERRFYHWCSQARLPTMQFRFPGCAERDFAFFHDDVSTALARMRYAMQVVREIEPSAAETTDIARAWRFVAVDHLYHNASQHEFKTNAEILDHLGFWPSGLIFDLSRVTSDRLRAARNQAFIDLPEDFDLTPKEGEEEGFPVFYMHGTLECTLQWARIAVRVRAKRVESRDVVKADMLVAKLDRNGSNLTDQILAMAGMKSEFLVRRSDNDSKLCDLAFVKAQNACTLPLPCRHPVAADRPSLKRKLEIQSLDDAMQQ